MKDRKVLKKFIKQQFRFEAEEQEIETYQEIKSGAHFSGYNIWILGLAMIIACIGLNTDSMSAVIGAMLISPLMGPIIGYAFALAIRDATLKNMAIRNWIWMTLISLLSSTVFFWLSPFDRDTQVILSFSKASIFDILIAFVGGMAGFIGIIKRDGVKVMAGVAVATACMPPLCTAGFGIAHGNLSEFVGGLYFYLINCLFIGLSTFMLAKFHGFREIGKQVHEKTNSISTFIWMLFIMGMILPGLYIARQKWFEEKHPHTEKVDSDKQRIQKVEQKIQQLDSMLQLQMK